MRQVRPREKTEGGRDFGLGVGVDHAGGFIEDEDRGVAEDGAGDGEALALPAREREALLGDGGVVTLREGDDELVGAGASLAASMTRSRVTPLAP